MNQQPNSLSRGGQWLLAIVLGAALTAVVGHLASKWIEHASPDGIVPEQPPETLAPVYHDDGTDFPYRFHGKKEVLLQNVTFEPLPPPKAEPPADQDREFSAPVKPERIALRRDPDKKSYQAALRNTKAVPHEQGLVTLRIVDRRLLANYYEYGKLTIYYGDDVEHLQKLEWLPAYVPIRRN